MKKVKIAHRDMSISKISEKILKISEDYEKAKEEDNKELMEELKKEYEYQKAVLNASENFFAKYDEKEMKDKANYSSDEEEVKRAKWILKNKKEYQDKEDLFDAIIASKSLEEAKEVVEEQKEDNINNKGELVWDSFKETCEAKSVPENMLAQSKEDVNLMYTNFAEMSGMTLDELLESFGMDEDGVSEIAEDSVIDVMIAKSIMAKENLTMDDTTYKNKLWTALGYEDGDDEKSLSDLEKEYKESQGSHPKNDMMIEVAKDYIGDQAKVSDGETTNE